MIAFQLVVHFYLIILLYPSSLSNQERLGAPLATWVGGRLDHSLRQFAMK